MEESEFIAIPKKEGRVECGKHRTISIMSKVAKIVLRVINEMLKKIRKQWTVFGFRKGKGTRNAFLFY